VKVDLVRFREALLDALEHISAFSLNNHQWNAVVDTLKIKPATFEKWSHLRPKSVIEAFRETAEAY